MQGPLPTESLLAWGGGSKQGPCACWEAWWGLQLPQQGEGCPLGPWQDGWKAGSQHEEQQGMWRTRSTLQRRCFMLASQPRAALGSVRAGPALVGLPGWHHGPPGCPLTRQVAFLPLIGLGRRRLPRTARGDL